MSKKAQPAQEPQKVRLVYIPHKGEGPEAKELVLHSGGGRPYGLKIVPYDREVGGEPTKAQIAEIPDPALAVQFVNSCAQLHFLHDDDLKLCFPNSSKKMRSPLLPLEKPEETQPAEDAQPEEGADEVPPVDPASTEKPKARKAKTEEK